MTKHQIVALHNADKFNEAIGKLESEGWQAMPSTLKDIGSLWSILMFKVESNSPYRTEAFHPSSPIPDLTPAPYPLKR